MLMHAAAAGLPFASRDLRLGLGASASALLVLVHSCLVLLWCLVLGALAAAGARSSTCVAIELSHRHARHKAAAKGDG